MKYLKTFEKRKYFDRIPHYLDFKVGDKVYCINNEDAEYLEIGKEYTVEFVSNVMIASVGLLGIGTFHSYRFSKDPNHPKIIQHHTNKYNL